MAGRRRKWRGIAPAVIAYLLPIVLWRRMPYLLLWWLWIVGVVGPLAAYDWVHDCAFAGDAEIHIAGVSGDVCVLSARRCLRRSGGGGWWRT